MLDRPSSTLRHLANDNTAEHRLTTDTIVLTRDYDRYSYRCIHVFLRPGGSVGDRDLTFRRHPKTELPLVGRLILRPAAPAASRTRVVLGLH